MVGGMLLGMIEGMGLLMNNFMSQQFRPVDPRCEFNLPEYFGHDECHLREEQQAMQMPEDPAALVSIFLWTPGL